MAVDTSWDLWGQVDSWDGADGDEGFDGDLWVDELPAYGEVLRSALREDLADVDGESLEEAVTSVFDDLSPAESFNFGKALQQLGQTAASAVSDPRVAQIVGTALPIAGGALGTVLGGPAGTALGSTLGSAVARSLPAGAGASPAPRAAVRPASPPVAGPPSPVTAPAGSDAALQALLLGQRGGLATLAAALGSHGASTIDNVPVAAVLRTLASLYGRAAADADELMFARREGSGSDDAEGWDDGAEDWSDDVVYSTMLDAENDHLAQAWGIW